MLPPITAHPEEPLSLPKRRLEGLTSGASRRAFALRQAQEPQSLLRMSGLSWISSLIFILVWLNVATPAKAWPGESSQYSYCRVALPVAGQTLTATRTLWPDGRFAFQTSYDPPGKALVRGKGSEYQRAYLTWRTKAGGGKEAAKLWVYTDEWIFAFPDEARLYARPLKGKPESEVELPGRIAKDGFYLHEFDPQTLLSAFPALDEIELVTHAPGKKSKSGTYAPPRTRFNLALLRGQLAALADVDAALDREQAKPGACKKLQPSGFEEADIANWNWCTLSQNMVVGGPPGVWSDGSRVTSQIWLGKGTLGFERDISDGKDGHPFLTGGFAVVRTFPFQHQFSAYVYARPQRLTLTSGTETLTFDIAQSSSSAPLNWSDLMRLDRTGAEIKYRQAYDNGKVLSEGSLPPGSFRALEAQMQKAYAQVLEMRKDPITHCSQQPPIIVT
jgi:hypothetical protein